MQIPRPWIAGVASKPMQGHCRSWSWQAPLRGSYQLAKSRAALSTVRESNLRQAMRKADATDATVPTMQAPLPKLKAQPAATCGLPQSSHRMRSDAKAASVLHSCLQHASMSHTATSGHHNTTLTKAALCRYAGMLAAMHKSQRAPQNWHSPGMQLHSASATAALCSGLGCRHLEDGPQSSQQRTVHRDHKAAPAAITVVRSCVSPRTPLHTALVFTSRCHSAAPVSRERCCGTAWQTCC